LSHSSDGLTRKPEEQTKVIEAITTVIQALSPADAIGPVEVGHYASLGRRAPADAQGILNPIAERIVRAVAAFSSDPSAQPILVQALNALTASFKGLSPAEDEMFDLSEDEATTQLKASAISAVRQDPRMIALRGKIEDSIKQVVDAWHGDAAVAEVSSHWAHRQHTKLTIRRFLS
jgi:hypothetical protein